MGLHEDRPKARANCGFSPGVLANPAPTQVSARSSCQSATAVLLHGGANQREGGNGSSHGISICREQLTPMEDFASVAAPDMPISVSVLNAQMRRLVESNTSLLWVSGEVSNFVRAPSGHCYFVLKDAFSQVRCTLFRQRAAYLDSMPKNGDSVEVRAAPTLYESRGEFQLNVEYLRLGGMGRLFEAFEKLKEKLKAQGLFAAERKRAIPKFARSVGVITSAAGAALRDVLVTLHRRMPGLQVIIYPTPVQGVGAAEHIAQAIEIASWRAECDVLVLCRGGGSIEDLWSFNEEVVARAIVASAIPVVSGVGHETDFTIADFVADARAPTPTAAAVMVSLDRAQWLYHLKGLRETLDRHFMRQLERYMQQLDVLARRLVHPGERLQTQRQHLQSLRERLGVGWERQVNQRRWQMHSALQHWTASKPDFSALSYRLERQAQSMVGRSEAHRRALRSRTERAQAKLESLDPRAVLGRGYSIVWDAQSRAISSTDGLVVGDPISIQFAHGQADATISAKQ